MSMDLSAKDISCDQLSNTDVCVGPSANVKFSGMLSTNVILKKKTIYYTKMEK